MLEKADERLLGDRHGEFAQRAGGWARTSATWGPQGVDQGPIRVGRGRRSAIDGRRRGAPRATGSVAGLASAATAGPSGGRLPCRGSQRPAQHRSWYDGWSSCLSWASIRVGVPCPAARVRFVSGGPFLYVTAYTRPWSFSMLVVPPAHRPVGDVHGLSVGRELAQVERAEGLDVAPGWTKSMTSAILNEAPVGDDPGDACIEAACPHSARGCRPRYFSGHGKSSP